MIFQFSKTGNHHIDTGTENQDVICSRDCSRYGVIALADGVSSCKEAGTGAKAACEAMIHLLSKKGGHLLNYPTEKIVEYLLSHIRYNLKKMSEDTGIAVEEYSSTAAAIYYEKRKDQLLLFSVGDSMILGSGGGVCEILSMPSDSTMGCCVTTTEYAERMSTVYIADAGAYDAVMICSDGAWRLMMEKNHLNADVKAAILAQDYESLVSCLEARSGFDDCSFAVMTFESL